MPKFNTLQEIEEEMRKPGGLRRIIEARKKASFGELNNFLVFGKILLDSSGGVFVDILGPENGDVLVQKFHEEKRCHMFSSLDQDVEEILTTCEFVFCTPEDEIKSFFEHNLLLPLEEKIARTVLGIGVHAIEYA